MRKVPFFLSFLILLLTSSTLIRETGLTEWLNPAHSIGVFFHLARTGKPQISIRARGKGHFGSMHVNGRVKCQDANVAGQQTSICKKKSGN